MYEDLYVKYQRLGNFSQQDWDQVAGLMQVKNLEKGEIFLHPGNSSDTFALIFEGVGRHYYVDNDGKEWTKSFAGPGDFLGAYAEMLQGLESRTFIEAVTAMKILKGSKRELEMMKAPQWDQVWRRLAEAHFIKKENREYEFLKLDALGRYEAYLRQYEHIDELIPRKYVASYLGITPQALSRLSKT